MMQTLYNTLEKYDNVTRYDEHFVTSLTVEDSEFKGLTAIDMKSGDFRVIEGKGCILATGGAGRLYAYTSYSHIATGDGYALAYRAGVPLKDIEFVQFHPTGLMPSGILITEASRGEGGYLLNRNGERFMERYAPKMMELAPRDIISRAEITEIEEGRGVEGPNGITCLRLDLRHLGADKINAKLPFVRELSIKFLGIDPIDGPIAIRPVQHYTMSGIHVDTYGACPVKGLWAAGEAACVSLHGANRLGTNSLAECLVYGRITGQRAAQYVIEAASHRSVSSAVAQEEEKRIFDGLLGRETGESVYAIRDQLSRIMDASMSIFRTGLALEEALGKIRELKQSYRAIRVEDQGGAYNTDLTSALEVENMLDLAEIMTLGAMARTESRGAHYRLDYPHRDDERWLKHTLAYYSPEGPKLDHVPVRITRWKTTERKY